jgi:hypothetical protein
MTISMINSQKEISAALDDSSSHSYLQQLKETYASPAEYVITNCRLLLRNVDGHESETRNSDLIALFERAGNLACQLHGRCVETKVLFSHHEMGGFSVDSRIMEAHTTMDIEQNDHEWDDNQSTSSFSLPSSHMAISAERTIPSSKSGQRLWYG